MVTPTASAAKSGTQSGDENTSFVLRADERTVRETSAVSQNWQNNAALRVEGQSSFHQLQQQIHLQNTPHEMSRERNYPQTLVQLFQHCHLPIGNLPVLDFSDRMGSTDYIDMLRPEDMTHPIMKFTDRFNRPGIAFHIEGYADEQVKVGDQLYSIREISVVLAIFQRYTNNDRWKVGMGGILSSAISDLHNEKHDQTDHIGPRSLPCATCPNGLSSGRNVSTKTLFNFLAGRDPFFRIAQGYVPPVDLPVPPGLD